MVFSRICPSCECELLYKSKYSKKAADLKNTTCAKCSAIKKHTKFKNIGWHVINSEVKNGMRKNGFSGKSHTPETLIKLSNSDKSYTQTERFRKTMSISVSGENNPMFGKSVYEVWKAKFGKSKADAKLNDYKNKQSSNFSGENNPMFGKPSPIGSGNGWSGWYKGWYFRSLLELSYMINVIERFNLKWESGENAKFSIKYTTSSGKLRTYYCDFIINGKYLVEIKPSKLFSTETNILKKKAAIDFCRDSSLTYKLTNCRRLNSDEISILIETNQIKLLDRYLIKYKNGKLKL